MSGISQPQRTFRRVVFPEPDRPTRATISPRNSSISTPSSTTTGSDPRRNLLTTPLATSNESPRGFECAPYAARSDCPFGGGAGSARPAILLIIGPMDPRVRRSAAPIGCHPSFGIRHSASVIRHPSLDSGTSFQLDHVVSHICD